MAYGHLASLYAHPDATARQGGLAVAAARRSPLDALTSPPAATAATVPPRAPGGPVRASRRPCGSRESTRTPPSQLERVDSDASESDLESSCRLERVDSDASESDLGIIS